MKTDAADMYFYSIIAGLFFFASGIIVRVFEVAVIGLLVSVVLLGGIVLFAMKDFGWFEKPTVVYVDKPVSVPQVATREVIHHYPSEPREIYREKYEEPKRPVEYEKDIEEEKYEDPFDDLDPIDNGGFLD